MNSAAIFKSYFDSTKDIVILIEATETELKLQYINQSAATVFGAPDSHLPQNNIIPQEYITHLHEKYNEAIHTGRPLTFKDETIYERTNIFAKTTITPIFENNKKYLLSVTKLSAADYELKNSNHFLEAFLAHTADATLILDKNDQIVKVSESFENMFGWKANEVIGISRKDIQMTPAPLLTELDTIIQKVKKGIKIPSYETLRMKKNGEVFPVSVSYSPILDRKQNFIAYTLIYRDIGHIKQLENELAESNEEYQSLFKYNNNAIYLLDLQGHIIKANTACEHLSGYSYQEIIHRHYSDFIHESDQDNISSYFKKVLEDKATNYEIRLMHKSGTTLYARITNVPVIVKGKIIGVYGIAQDITKETLAEIELEKTLKELENIKYAIDESSILAITDKYGVITHVNEMFSTISQYKKEELIGQTHRIINSGHHSKEFFEEMWKTIRSGEVWRNEIKNKAKDGSFYWVHTTIVPLLNTKGEITHYISIRTDITDRKVIEEELRQSEKKYRIITESSSDLITIMNTRGIVTYASPSYKESLGIPTNEIVGKHFSYHIFEADKQKLKHSCALQIKEEKIYTNEFRYVNSQGKPVWVECKSSPVHNKNGSIDRIITIGRIITKRKRYEEELKFQAFHDQLTGLPNRTMLKEKVKEAIQYTDANERKTFGLLFLDCDNFKRINDTYGHEVGDQFLVKFSHRLQQSIRDEDIVFRIGGDEFVILLNKIQDSQEITSIANRVHSALQDKWCIKHHSFHTTSSIGMALYPQHGKTLEQLLFNADKALYEVKREGKNSYRFSD
ncbi:PAS domain S-box protein [Bacillus tianshenii]|nr:PAS domain S-box protein [Bacillus tianshenii]